MNVLDFFRKSLNSGNANTNELPEIFPLALQADVFIKADMLATYTKILTDTLDRTHGIPEEDQSILWDNCVQSESTDGLVSLLAIAMVNKTDLFLVYKSGILRKATNEEQQKIIADYKKNAESKEGVFISFKNYRRTDMLHIYSALEYAVLASLHKTVNVSKAVQVKISDLRKSVSLSDATIALAQAQAIANALRAGRDVALDKNDEITTATPNIEPTEKAIQFLDAKKAFILGLPMAYISGIQTGGIGSTGEADMRAVERGLKQYFLTIIQPVLKALLNVDVTFRSQDFRQIAVALEALKTFDLVSDEHLSQQAKQEILRRMFEIDEAAEEKALLDEEKERARTAPTPRVVAALPSAEVQ